MKKKIISTPLYCVLTSPLCHLSTYFSIDHTHKHTIHPYTYAKIFFKINFSLHIHSVFQNNSLFVMLIGKSYITFYRQLL